MRKQWRTGPPSTTDQREDDDPVRVCEFAKQGPDVLTIEMRSRLVGPKGPL
jgi:hypothetical protein